MTARMRFPRTRGKSIGRRCDHKRRTHGTWDVLRLFRRSKTPDIRVAGPGTKRPMSMIPRSRSASNYPELFRDLVALRLDREDALREVGATRLALSRPLSSTGPLRARCPAVLLRATHEAASERRVSRLRKHISGSRKDRRHWRSWRR